MRALSAACFAVVLQVLFVSSVFAQSSNTPYDSVDPLIGTAGGGNTFPGATLPFGMIQWSPDTDQDAWYRYDEKKLYGFSLTHVSGAGCPLYGDFAVLPVLDQLTASPGTKFMPMAFDRKDEQAQPGYYAVTLTNGVRIELTVTERAGMAIFKFPAGVPKRFLINAGSSANSVASPNDDPKIREAFGNHIEVKADGSFSGWASAGRFCGSDSNYKIYVAGKFSRPIDSVVMWQDDAVLKNAKSATGKHTGAWVEFNSETEKEEGLGIVGELTMFPLNLKIGISYVSEEGARANLEKEIPGWDFESVHQQAQRTWNERWIALRSKAGRRSSGRSSIPACITRFYRRRCSAMRTGSTWDSTARCIRLRGRRRRRSMRISRTGTFIATRCSGRRCLSPSARAT